MKITEYINHPEIDNVIKDIIDNLHSTGPTNSQEFEKLSYIKKFHPQTFSMYESKLMHLIGLFYKTTKPSNIIEEVYSIFADTIQAETGHRFTPVQASAFQKITNKNYFSFSAPTSSGKSYLFRELILKAETDIIIVVPSRALISEYLFRVRELLKGDNSVLVLQFIENVNINRTSRRIYIITPERGEDLFSIIHSLNIGLFLFDEAQISEERIRGMRFDSFVRRVDKLLPNAKKVFTHPFVQNPEAQLKKHGFVNNSDFARYNHNSVGKIFLSEKNNTFKYFSPYAENIDNEQVFVEVELIENILKNNGTLLVYISKSKIYDGSYILDFAKYIELCPKIENIEAIEIINELRDFIGASERAGEKHSYMIDMMEIGIVVHHGSMPLFARLLIEKFVNKSYAKICFATSTLTQGINMPFDVVWINNFRFDGDENKKNLDLKNLIGRAGRSTLVPNSFDYGYVVIESKNVARFCNRMRNNTSLKETSMLDSSIDDLPEDLKDISEAIKNDSFNNDLHLTESQIERLSNADINSFIEFILESFLKDNIPITGKDYYNLDDDSRNKVKNAFKQIYISHLRKNNLTRGEASVLSVSIPILLWKIQGKSFKEIVSLRHAFLTNKDEQRRILSRLRKNEISSEDASQLRKSITIRHSTIATPLPDPSATTAGIFPRNTSIIDFDYDILVYDTYDYLDKVISLSLSDPLAAAFQLYYNQTLDQRALTLRNYIKYGTNDELEIWLLRYGFGFEEIDWLKQYIEYVDENEIIFSQQITNLSPTKFELIERYV
ncbi:DEAD/DEAH box helicase [Paludibacter jiangxiensis]|uniref:Helicase conserved C-terminal domain-containing protein n=1 Tax=Paludibacter jiangxiensis TaxID=681398 RepID=A0A161LF48_9BACT|nr:DEAD/DEAH box helicase [Paludibacter jiangxiensis]GAT63535.1 helicase conserved C-terminal domain-containing protein [Paludibacter jiangxiensis]